jgi:hypothetical protein
MYFLIFIKILILILCQLLISSYTIKVDAQPGRGAIPKNRTYCYDVCYSATSRTPTPEPNRFTEPTPIPLVTGSGEIHLDKHDQL